MQTLHHARHAHLGDQKTVSQFRESSSTTHEQLARGVLSQCHGCQERKDKNLRNTTASSMHVNFPWHTLAFEIMCPFAICHIYQFIISVVDFFFSKVFDLRTASRDALTLARALMDCVVSYFGIPVGVLSDKGLEFTTSLW